MDIYIKAERIGEISPSSAHNVIGPSFVHLDKAHRDALGLADHDQFFQTFREAYCWLESVLPTATIAGCQHDPETGRALTAHDLFQMGGPKAYYVTANLYDGTDYYASWRGGTFTDEEKASEFWGSWWPDKDEVRAAVRELLEQGQANPDEIELEIGMWDENGHEHEFWNSHVDEHYVPGRM